MTGYGPACHSCEGPEITVEIRSVNNRYLDCNIKLPRIYSYTEERIKHTINEPVTRGKVDVFVTVTNTTGEEMKISLNRPVLEGYLAAMQTMAKEYHVCDDISVTALSRLPEVFLVEKPEVDEEARAKEIYDTVTEALHNYNAMRTVEGAALEQDLLNRRETILALVAKVEERSPVTVAEYRSRLEAKMQEVLSSTTIDESRILTEAAVFADKVAVDEETVRLRSHLNQLQTMLASGGAIGRKLDFLLQEMNREANTIGSKGNDLEQARTVVDIKAELEKIREQTQNIE
jgi:uncharacterized protein (TIGR00255 family)